MNRWGATGRRSRLRSSLHKLSSRTAVPFGFAQRQAFDYDWRKMRGNLRLGRQLIFDANFKDGLDGSNAAQ